MNLIINEIILKKQNNISSNLLCYTYKISFDANEKNNKNVRKLTIIKWRNRNKLQVILKSIKFFEY